VGPGATAHPSPLLNPGLAAAPQRETRACAVCLDCHVYAGTVRGPYSGHSNRLIVVGMYNDPVGGIGGG